LLQEEVEAGLGMTDQSNFMGVEVVQVAWWKPHPKRLLEKPVMNSVLALAVPAIKTEETAF
jgi:hypothetical protein